MLTKEAFVSLCMKYQQERKAQAAKNRKRADKEFKDYMYENHFRIERKIRGCR